MNERKTSFERLLSVMPEGWEAKAKELGALVREREIKSALDLLRMVFLYLTEGKSFSGTAVLLQRAGICSISEKAAFTRFQKRGEWLRWPRETICRNNKGIVEAPQWLGERKVYAAEAGGEPARGSGGADCRSRCATGLFDLGMKEMALTGTERGEKAGNFTSFGEGEIVIGGRGKQGIECLLGRGGDFLRRFGTKRFDVYNARGRKANAPGRFIAARGKRGEGAVLRMGGGREPPRFRVLRKTKEAEENGLKALRKARKRKHGDKEPGEARTAYNRHVIVITSITDAAAELTLEVYRQRRRIELAFKRLKSLFKCHEMPAHVEQSALSWFYGKLLLAALCETWASKGRFSPWEGKGAG